MSHPTDVTAEPAVKPRLGNELYTGRKSFPIVKNRRRWLAAAAGLVVLSLLILLIRGINPGIEFRGGSEFTISGTTTTAEAPALDVMSAVDAEQVPRVSQVGQNAVRVQTEELTNEQTTQVQERLAEAYGVSPEEVTSNYVGPTWGADVSQKALTSLVVFLVLVTVVMTLYFRNLRIALGGIIALLHDVLVTVGVYAAVGFEVTPATVIGFLTILGYSLYDTVVVFDKVRELTQDVYDQKRYTFAEYVNLAVNQTMVRSINTSVVALLPVGAILIIGSLMLGTGSLRDIALALFVGMLLSMISSIFVATPVVVALQMRDPRYREHRDMVLAKRAARRRAELGLPAQDAEGAANEEDVDLDLTARPEDLHPDVVPGRHLGHAAQPRRQTKGKRS